MRWTLLRWALRRMTVSLTPFALSGGGRRAMAWVVGLSAASALASIRAPAQEPAPVFTLAGIAGGGGSSRGGGFELSGIVLPAGPGAGGTGLSGGGFVLRPGLGGETGVGPPFVRGDANEDGSVDVADAIRILLHLFAGLDLESCERAADADDSGTLEITDPIVLLEFLFARGAPLPEPAAGCGLDPTPDTLACERFGPCG